MSSRRKRSVPTEDRISKLPDFILCHILSFLPTKVAATTSLLSKRWNPLWLSTLTLKFNYRTFKNFSTFRHFVYSFFMSRDSKLPIQSFHLKCRNSPDCDLHDVNRIVSAALQRGGIENLNLCIYNMNLHTGKKLAPCIFSVLSCKTLVALKFMRLVIFDVPPILNLPLLKTLHLYRIRFLCNYTNFQQLLSGCPVLEELHLYHVPLSGFSNFGPEGRYNNLLKLVTANLSNVSPNFPFAWVHNAKFLRAEQMQTYENQIPTFHNLIDMELIFDSEKWQVKWNWVIKVLKDCPKLQNLTIDEVSKKVNVIGDEDWMDPETVPECLQSQLKTCLLKNYKGFKCEFQFAEYIMHNSKQLDTMTIKSSFSGDKNAKLQRIVKLSMCSRGSGTCKLLFD